MIYQVVRANGNYIHEEPFYSKIVSAFIKDETVVKFNSGTVTIESSSSKDGVTSICVTVE